MIKKSIFIAIFSISIISCNNQTDIISEKKMTKVLLDLHLAEALAQHLPKDSITNELKNSDSLNHFTAEILKTNQIKEQQFIKSMNFYKDNPNQLDSMYQNILSQLTILQSQKKE